MRRKRRAVETEHVATVGGGRVEVCGVGGRKAGGGGVERSEWRVVDALGSGCGGRWTRWAVGVAGLGREKI